MLRPAAENRRSATRIPTCAIYRKISSRLEPCRLAASTRIEWLAGGLEASETRPCHPWQVARRQLLQQQRRALATTVIRPVGEWGAETGLPGPDPAGTRALENFVSGMPASFCTDIAYRLAAFQQADVDNSKTVDLAELQTLLLELHPAAQPEDAAGLLAAADENGDGVLQVGEFMRLFENSYATTMRERNEDRHD